MALIDFFKRKKESPKREKEAEAKKQPAFVKVKVDKSEDKTTGKKKEKKSPAVKVKETTRLRQGYDGQGQKKEKKSEVLEPAKPLKKKTPGAAYGILLAPHITEKANDLTKENKYIFKVSKHSNKYQIKKAVEGDYGVNVVGVRVINIKKKEKRLGRQIGFKKGYKKAIVKIREGEKIELLPR